MNNIHEKDWAEESWSGHTGMDSFSDYNIGDEKAEEVLGDQPEAKACCGEMPLVKIVNRIRSYRS